MIIDQRMILIQSILIINYTFFQIFLKMNNEKKARVLKILDGTVFHLQDSETSSSLMVQLWPQPIKPFYYHLLQKLSETEITYELGKKTPRIKQQTPKCSIFLEGKSLSELYTDDKEIPECTDDKKYEKDEIIQCYIMGIQCLKMKLYLLEDHKYLTFYFSELKLPKIENAHPKEVWVKAEEYFRTQFLGDFVQVKINGSESYRDQRNIYGQILKLHNGVDIKQKCLEDGYAQLSKNSQKYLSTHEIQKLTQKIQQSKSQKRGIWGCGQQKISKGTNQLTQQKYVMWEQWTKKKQKFPQIKNIEQQLKQLSSQLKKNNPKDPNKCRIVVETVMNIFEQSTTEKNLSLLQQFIKNVIGALINIQTFINSNTDNYDFLRYLNKLFIIVLFFVMEGEKLANKNKNMTIATQLEKIIKVAFKCSFIGNETFHQRVFDRRKETDFGTFEFDQASLSGISSYSQASDIQEKDKESKYSKTQKKISSAQTKIRINATLLIGSLFKNFPSIVENHWQICVKSNILTKQFMDYLQKLKIAVEPTKMTLQQKSNIVSLMRTNFGDYNLVLLVFFQQNAKVKMNVLNCLIHMIGNFQSRKIIDTTEAVYVQKLLNQTKSSFVPKSFIVFSGLRNALYFMLFSLYHERNILIIMNTFKALTQLCQQSTLIDKMGFIQGMGLLMSNYICPVLKFPWEGKQLIQLKCLCVEFLGALVNTQKKWDQMENLYLMSEGEKNINSYLVSAFIQDKNSQQHQKIVFEIAKYFKNMTKRYLPAIFYEIIPGVSIWNSMANYYLKYPNQIYPTFVQQIFKCHFDQLSQIKSQQTQSRKILETTHKVESLFGAFLSQFFSVYSKIVTNQNYIGLLSIMTYVPYHKWSQSQFKSAKQFLNHCFKNINQENAHKTYPSFQALKSNSLVRLGIIKLLGYISFCKEFQNPEYSTLAIKSLLEYSRTYKSPNSVVKITWGISNWSNIDCFKEGLTQKQLKECLDYMIKLSQSDKQKIASNCTRGIGFFLAKFNKDVNLQECRLAIIKNLSHPILKVRINSTKTLRMMINIGLVGGQEYSQKTQELIGILQQNILKNNYHLQTQTLLLIKDLGNPIKEKHMMKIYSHILHDLLSHTTMEYEFSEIKALKQLRKVVLSEMVKYPEYLLEGSQTAKQFYQTVENFIVDSQEESLRKQAENSKILERGFQKGEEALNAVFNIVKQKYDEEKTITTSFTTRGIQYEAEEADLQLLGQIKSISKELEQKDVETQKLKWKFLAEMKIQEKKIFLGKY